MSAPSRVEFKTFDGVTLRGDLLMPYHADEPKGVPLILMTQGLTLLKEHYIPAFARRFQAAGIAVLLYDHRSWGSSDGTPRNQTDPAQQAEDYHDAVLFARTLPGVDKDRVAIWGIGHSAGASMIAAGDDPHVKAVVLIMPFTSGAADAAAWPAGALDAAYADRAATVSGRTTATTYYAPVWDDTAAQAVGERGATLLHGPPAFEFISGAQKLSSAADTPWENKITLQSLYYIARAEPRDHIHKISPRPLLYLAAAVDAISGPFEAQQEVFARAREPKQFVRLEDHHIGNYFGESFERNIAAQVDFLKKNL